MSEAPKIEEPFFVETMSSKLLAYDYADSCECVELEIFGTKMNHQYFISAENIRLEYEIVRFDIVFERKGHPEKRFIAGNVVMTRSAYESNIQLRGVLPTHVAYLNDGGVMCFCAFKVHDSWYSMNGFMQHLEMHEEYDIEGEML